jgi:hypothetical protein
MPDLADQIAILQSEAMEAAGKVFNDFAQQVNAGTGAPDVAGLVHATTITMAQHTQKLWEAIRLLAAAQDAGK